MAKDYPLRTILYAENSRVYMGVIDIIELPPLHLGGGEVQQRREYTLVNSSGSAITLSAEAMAFSLREIPDVGSELITHQDRLRSGGHATWEIDALCMEMNKALKQRREVA